MIRFIKNVWRFRKELSNFQDWDYNFNLDLFKKSLQFTHDYMKKDGLEVDEDRLPKVEIMQEVIDAIDKVSYHDFIDEAETQLCVKATMENTSNKDSEFDWKYTEHSKRVYKLSDELEQKNWNKIWDLIKNNMQGWWD